MTVLSLLLHLEEANVSLADALCQNAIRTKSTIRVQDAKEAWSLLSPDKVGLRIRSIRDGFCPYFFHIYLARNSGNEKIPYQVPVDIRARIHPRYGLASRKIATKSLDLVRWISTLEGEEQVVSLIALLEIKIHTEGPLESHELFRSVSTLVGQMEILKRAPEDQMSNFFATFVRAFSKSIGQGDPEKVLADSLDYFAKFWTFCMAEYAISNAGNHLSVFKTTIEKLENIDIPLCLWVFMAGSGTGLDQNLNDHDVGQMYFAMKTVLNDRLRRLLDVSPRHMTMLSDVSPMFMTVQFIIRAGEGSSYGFFEIMHRVIIAQGNEKAWGDVWGVCKRRGLYTALRQQTESNVKVNDSMIQTLFPPASG